MSTILIVDDEPAVASTLKVLLENYSYEVQCVVSANDAIKVLKNGEIDVVISDIVMPGNSGLDLVRMMQANDIDVPVILVSGEPTFENANEALRLRVFDFLTKPIDTKRLLDLVNSATRERKILLENSLLEKRKKDYLHAVESQLQQKVKQLFITEEKIELILEQNLVAMYVIQDAKLVHANAKFYELIGMDENQSSRNPRFDQFISIEDISLVDGRHSEILSGKTDYHQSKLHIHRPDGHEFEAEMWETKYLHEEKPAILGMLIDISERETYQKREKVFQLNMMHEHKLASVGLLATGIAHNLNTPISVILGNAELLHLKYGDSPELKKIIRQAERMSGIIQGLMIKSKQEQSQTPQEIDLNVLISNELEFLTANLEFKHNVEKEFHFDENCPEIFAVYSDFSQSIMNIIQNAIDAMYNRPQKVLTVTTKYEEPNIILTISDTGCGIPDQNYENLFDPFFTTKRSPQESNQNEPTGTGLGLSTVHSLLLPYAVEIGIESVVEQGTTFKLTIPASKLQPPVEN